MFFAILKEIVEVIIIIWYFFNCKIFAKTLTKIKNLTIFSLVFFQLSTIDNVQFLQLSNCPHSNVRISKFLAHWVVFNIQRLDTLD